MTNSPYTRRAIIRIILDAIAVVIFFTGMVLMIFLLGTPAVPEQTPTPTITTGSYR